MADRFYAYSEYGFYQTAMVSGTIAAALAADAVVFFFRWGASDGNAIVSYIKLSFQALTAFTAATLTDFGFDGYFARGFTASHTGGTAATLTGDSFKVRTAGMASTKLTDMRIASTAALGAGTLTAAGNAFVNSLGDTQMVNPAAATEEQRVNDPTLEYAPDLGAGEHPLFLTKDEGFVLRNRAVWPVAGTGVIAVQVRWREVSIA